MRQCPILNIKSIFQLKTWRRWTGYAESAHPSDIYKMWTICWLQKYVWASDHRLYTYLLQYFQISNNGQPLYNFSSNSGLPTQHKASFKNCSFRPEVLPTGVLNLWNLWTFKSSKPSWLLYTDRVYSAAHRPNFHTRLDYYKHGNWMLLVVIDCVVSHKNSYVEDLIPITSKCDCIWR